MLPSRIVRPRAESGVCAKQQHGVGSALLGRLWKRVPFLSATVFSFNFVGETRFRNSAPVPGEDKSDDFDGSFCV